MRPVRVSLIILGLCICSVGRSQEANVADKPVPQITQREMFEALGLEMAKIRITDIPVGKPVMVELTEWTERPLRSRQIAHLSVTPATDWIEFLISAHKQPTACPRFDITIRHESPLFWTWPIDIEKRFGADCRAIPLRDRDHFLNLDSHTYRYEGQQLQIAQFRLQGKKTGTHYMITLNAYPPSDKKGGNP